MTAPAAVVVTDLDGTLLDHLTYEPGPAEAAVRRLREAGIAVVFCSSKTRAEQVELRRRLGVTDPFIVENGAALWWNGRAEVFGLRYEEVRRRLLEAAAEAGVTIRGYGDLTVDEVATLTGLDPAAAARARDREHTESFLLEPEERAGELRAAATRRGLRLVRGSRMWTAQGTHDKGTAVRRLLETWGRPPSYGIGDHEADRELLEAVDHPMVVRRPDGSWVDLQPPGLLRLDGVGPEGWVQAAERVLEEVSRRGGDR